MVRRDDGMVSAEMASVLPVLILVLWAALAAVQVAQARVRCADAAREAALAIARGDTSSAVRVASDAAGRTVSLTSSRSADNTAQVTVAFTLQPLAWVGALTVRESTFVKIEGFGSS